MRLRLATALLALASALGTLLLADLVLLVVHGPVRVVEDFYEPDARFGYRMRPHLQFEFASPYHGYRATVRTNELGLRGASVAVPKPAGVLRVLLLGDSMTAGLEVDGDQTFAAVAERRLGAERRVEVVNAGVRGYNLDNILGFLDTVGLALEPDAVVYMFTDNDLTSEPAYTPATGDVSRGFGLRGRLAVYSHITYRLEILRQRWALRRQRDAGAGQGERVTLPGGLVAFFTRPDFDADAAFRLTAQRIEALAARAAARGSVFVLAGAPHREEIDPEVQRELAGLLGPRFGRVDFDGVRRYLDGVAARIGVPRLDPVPEFRRRLQRDHHYWFHRDNHLNASGHRLLGEILAARVEALLPDAAP